MRVRLGEPGESKVFLLGDFYDCLGLLNPVFTDGFLRSILFSKSFSCWTFKAENTSSKLALAAFMS